VPLPTFFIIGAPRSGTTSLHRYLDLHPEISMSRVKEPHYFVDNVLPPARAVRDRSEYESLFSDQVNVRGEASPSYTCFAQHRGAPDRIREAIPDAKFIYLVRDPVARTVSHYQHRVAVENERRPFAQALGDIEDPANPYTCPSRYGTQLELYLRHFPRDRFLVIEQAGLLGERTRVLSDIFTFLDVDPSFSSPEFEDLGDTSANRRTYAPGYMDFVNRAAATPLRVIPRPARRGLRRALERVVFPPVSTPELTPELRVRLQSIYAPEAAKLRSLTALPFANWSV
jgi:hypothetical protein